MDDKKIVALLDETGNLPFYFGGYDIAYFWRIAKVDGKIYVQRVVYTDVKQEESFSCCLASDESSKQEIFDDVVLDFAVFYADVWLLPECRRWIDRPAPVRHPAQWWG